VFHAYSGAFTQSTLFCGRYSRVGALVKRNSNDLTAGLSWWQSAAHWQGREWTKFLVRFCKKEPLPFAVAHA
jgi:hypothetical protein